jgi:hypothetical protein
MMNLDLKEIQSYVNDNIGTFHKRRAKALEELKLNKLIKKNTYLFKAKNITTANDLISSLLDAFLSSSEEEIFGDFLEGLAVFIAQKTYNGHKSSAQGIDVEFIKEKIHYVVSMKSSTNWGNSSQQNKLENDLKIAVARLKQQHKDSNIQPVLGICFGKTKTSFIRGYMKVVGQNFWYLISGSQELYKEIIEPIGYKAKQHNDDFNLEKSKIINRFTKAFIEQFCGTSGEIDWKKLVEFNCGNLETNEH